jgi:hypothetical protein
MKIQNGNKNETENETEYETENDYDNETEAISFQSPFPNGIKSRYAKSSSIVDSMPPNTKETLKYRFVSERYNQ